MTKTCRKGSCSKLFVLSGPSGVGRTTIINTLLEDLDNIGFSISYTTRGKRAGEEDGKDYHFVSESTFKNLIKQGQFLEWALVFGNYYGTHKSEVGEKLAGGQDVILDIDVQGAGQLMGKSAHDNPVVFIFLAPPSIPELRKRLKNRGTENQDQLSMRIQNATEELKHIPEFDYLVINDHLSEAIKFVKSIILAERCRIDQRFGEEDAGCRNGD